MVTLLLCLIYLFLGRITSWSLAVTVAIYMGRKSKLWGSVVVALILGLVEDITYVRPLGQTSLILVTLTILMRVIESIYRSQSWWWWLGMGLGGEIVVRLVGQKAWSWQAVVGQLLILWVIFWISRRFGETEGIYVG